MLNAVCLSVWESCLIKLNILVPYFSTDLYSVIYEFCQHKIQSGLQILGHLAAQRFVSH